MIINRFYFSFLILFVLSISSPGYAQDDESQTNPSSPAKEFAEQEQEADEFLSLGVRKDYQKVERYNTVEQINTFIPPLYQPAFVGHGYVLPPGAMRIGAGLSFLDVKSDDFFKNGHADLVHENHNVDRLRADVNVFYGLDHNMTLFFNIPYWVSRSIGSVHPAGVRTMDLFVEGNTQAIGDASLVLKKKWVDQGNFYFNFATVTGIKFPTGSDDEKFDQPMVVRTPNGSLGTAFGGGAFPRFTDEGTLPQVLQPGSGNLATFSDSWGRDKS